MRATSSGVSSVQHRPSVGPDPARRSVPERPHGPGRSAFTASGGGVPCRGAVRAPGGQVALATRRLPGEVRRRVRDGGPARLRRGRGDGLDRPGEPGRRGAGTALGPLRRAGARGARADPAGHATGLGSRAVAEAGAVLRAGAAARCADGRGAPAVPLAARVRRGVRRRRAGARRAARRPAGGGEHVPVAGRGPRDAGLPCPAGTRFRSRTPQVTLDLSHTSTAGGDALAMAARSGRGCTTSTWPTAPARPGTSISFPAAAPSRARRCSGCSPSAAGPARSWSR